MIKALPPGSPCTNCGKCCTNPDFMANLTATREDVLRWRREYRYDILRFCDVTKLPRGGVIGGDLWIDSEAPEDRNPERERCPFVRKMPGTNRYLCRIYETRPQVCRDYVPWSGQANDVCEVVE